MSTGSAFVAAHCLGALAAASLVAVAMNNQNTTKHGSIDIAAFEQLLAGKVVGPRADSAVDIGITAARTAVRSAPLVELLETGEEHRQANNRLLNRLLQPAVDAAFAQFRVDEHAKSDTEHADHDADSSISNGVVKATNDEDYDGDDELSATSSDIESGRGDDDDHELMLIDDIVRSLFSADAGAACSPARYETATEHNTIGEWQEDDCLSGSIDGDATWMMDDVDWQEFAQLVRGLATQTPSYEQADSIIIRVRPIYPSYLQPQPSESDYAYSFPAEDSNFTFGV